MKLRTLSRSSYLTLIMLVMYASSMLRVQSANTPSLWLSELPPQVRAQIERQKAAMSSVHITATEFIEDPELIYQGGSTTGDIYITDNQFRIHKLALSKSGLPEEETDESFDGTIAYTGALGQSPRARSIVTKSLVADETDLYRTFLSWDYRYLDFAGYYVPTRIYELTNFSGIEPLALDYLRNSTNTQVRSEGSNYRITTRVPDPVLMAARAMNLSQYKAWLLYRHSDAEFIKKEIAMYEVLRNLDPQRKVTFLLDSEHGYMVSERDEWNASGERIVSIRSEKWRQLREKDMWLPNRCKALIYGNVQLNKFSKNPLSTITCDLNQIVFSFGPVAFDLTRDANYAKAGTAIVDRTLAESRVRTNHQIAYSIAASGRLLRTSADNIKSETQIRMYRHVFIFILLLPSVVAAIVYIRRRHAQRHST